MLYSGKIISWVLQSHKKQTIKRSIVHLEVTLIEGKEDDLFVYNGPDRSHIEQRRVVLGERIVVKKMSYFGLENVGSQSASFDCLVFKKA